jgi:hypothetical protein|tara:strand:- start:902 stop:1231 length:330 start_codon:yes stop_codon:yes gene_type:complete
MNPSQLGAKQGVMMSKFEIGGHTYKVNEVTLEKNDEGKSLLGMHDVKTNTILVDEGMTHSRKVETFMHEVIHVIYANTGCDHDERAIDALSNGLLQLGVADFLWKKVKK